MIGRRIIFAAAEALVLHEERAQLPGGCLLASNHQSYFDSMVLVGTSTRLIDWLSIVELFQKPGQRQIMQGLNCLALDRSQPDPATIRALLGRLRAGRMVGFFPEAGLREGRDSVLHGGDLSEGAVRLAAMARVPLLPVVVLGAGQFDDPGAWLPGAQTFLAINYGEPIYFRTDQSRSEALETLANDLRLAYGQLFAELKEQPAWRKNAIGPWWMRNFFDKCD